MLTDAVDLSIMIIGVWFMVFNTTFNNISVKLWWSVLLVEETRIPGENHSPAGLIKIVKIPKELNREITTHFLHICGLF
jgi:hypothetical protein